jgi:hypothetical protein
MFTQVLGWIVLVAPVVLAAIFIFIPARGESPMTHRRWRIGLMVAAVIYSGITWWQQSRASTEAQKASRTVAEETTRNVTKALGEQYESLIKSLTGQIGDLKGQLAIQGEKVDVIQQSNIVTGKKPIKVEVTNQETSQSVPKVGPITMTPIPYPSIHVDAPACTKLVFSSEFPVRDLGLMVHFSAPIKYVDSLVTFVYKGWQRIDESDKKQINIVMLGFNGDALSPDRPIAIVACSDRPFKPLTLERRNVVEQ